MPIPRQRVDKHIPAEAKVRNKERPQHEGNIRVTSVAKQRAVNITIEEVFSI